MKEFKGTKGEWESKFETYEFCDTGDYECDATVKKGKTTICQVFQDDEEKEANAKLIAAAPDLLEALQDLIKEYESKGQLLGYDVNIARKAIEKALN